MIHSKGEIQMDFPFLFAANHAEFQTLSIVNKDWNPHLLYESASNIHAKYAKTYFHLLSVTG